MRIPIIKIRRSHRLIFVIEISTSGKTVVAMKRRKAILRWHFQKILLNWKLYVLLKFITKAVIDVMVAVCGVKALCRIMPKLNPFDNGYILSLLSKHIMFLDENADFMSWKNVYTAASHIMLKWLWLNSIYHCLYHTWMCEYILSQRNVVTMRDRRSTTNKSISNYNSAFISMIPRRGNTFPCNAIAEEKKGLM